MESILQQVEAEVLHLYMKLKLLSAHIIQNENHSSVRQQTEVGCILSREAWKFFFRASIFHGPCRHLLISKHGSIYSHYIWYLS